MNILAWVLSLSILVWLMIQAVSFHKATVCRQKAWLKSTELITRTVLYKAQPHERAWDLGCKIQLSRRNNTVTWNHHTFSFTLEGKL